MAPRLVLGEFDQNADETAMLRAWQNSHEENEKLNGPIEKTDKADQLLPALKYPKPAIENLPPKMDLPEAPFNAKRLRLPKISGIDEMADGVAIA